MYIGERQHTAASTTTAARQSLAKLLDVSGEPVASAQDTTETDKGPTTAARELDKTTTSKTTQIQTATTIVHFWPLTV